MIFFLTIMKHINKMTQVWQFIFKKKCFNIEISIRFYFYLKCYLRLILKHVFFYLICSTLIYYIYINRYDINMYGMTSVCHIYDMSMQIFVIFMTSGCKFVIFMTYWCHTIHIDEFTFALPPSATFFWRLLFPPAQLYPLYLPISLLLTYLLE